LDFLATGLEGSQFDHFSLVGATAQEGKQTSEPVAWRLRLAQLDCKTTHLGILMHFLEVLFHRNFREPHDCLTFPDVLTSLEYWKGET
jgi:hypothetical protein